MKWTNGRLAALLVAAGILVSGISLSNPFYYDDYSVLRDNAWVSGTPPAGLWLVSRDFDSRGALSGYRPALMMSFWLNAKITGMSPASFRAVNILLHLLAALLAVGLLTRLRRRNGP